MFPKHLNRCTFWTSLGFPSVLQCRAWESHKVECSWIGNCAPHHVALFHLILALSEIYHSHAFVLRIFQIPNE